MLKFSKRLDSKNLEGNVIELEIKLPLVSFSFGKKEKKLSFQRNGRAEIAMDKMYYVPQYITTITS